MRVLLIEDHPECANIVTDMLRDEGHNVTAVQKADDAVKQIEDISKFDLVVLDIMLRRGKVHVPADIPETGIMLYKTIREKPSPVPVLVLSARGKNDIWRFFEGDGKADYQSKPVETRTSTFLRKVKELVE